MTEGARRAREVTIEMMTLETMESLRALWQDGPSRPIRHERTARPEHANRIERPGNVDWRLLRETEQPLPRGQTTSTEGPEQRRFEEWVERLGYGDGGRWCCPVEDTFGEGWRAGYADGVQAAVRLLRAAYESPESAEALHAVRRVSGGRERDTL